MIPPPDDPDLVSNAPSFFSEEAEDPEPITRQVSANIDRQVSRHSTSREPMDPLRPVVRVPAEQPSISAACVWLERLVTDLEQSHGPATHMEEATILLSGKLVEKRPARIPANILKVHVRDDFESLQKPSVAWEKCTGIVVGQSSGKGKSARDKHFGRGGTGTLLEEGTAGDATRGGASTTSAVYVLTHVSTGTSFF